MKTIAIMRPEQHLKRSIELAKSHGYKVIAAPMVEIKERSAPEFDVFAHRILNGEVDYVIFTSVNGVRLALKKAGRYMLKSQRDYNSRRCSICDISKFVDALNACNTVAVGPSTQREMEKHGIRVDVVPEAYSSEGIVSVLAPHIRGKKVEIVRSSHGAPLLIDGLKKHGAIIHEVKVYEIVRPIGGCQRKLIEAALNGDIDIYAFTSAMSVKNFLRTGEDLDKKGELIEGMKHRTVVAIGNPTAGTLRENGIRVDVLPERFTFKDMMGALLPAQQ